MREFALDLLQGRETESITPQFQLSAFNGLHQVQSKIFFKKCRPPKETKRPIVRNSQDCMIQSLPYGWTEKLLYVTRQKYNISTNNRVE